MKKAYRATLFALCLVMLTGLIVGCSGNPAATQAPATNPPASGGSTQPAATATTAPEPLEIKEITYLTWDRGTIPASQGTLEANWWIDYVNEGAANFGVKVSYVAIPFAQETQLLSTMLAANTAPDICKTSNNPLIKTYISGGGMTDITALIDAYGDNIKTLLGDAHLKEISIEGKIYYLPHLQNGITGRTTWIRKDWLDALGLEVPATAEEFHEVLKAVKEQDPGNVGAALIPFGMMRQTYSNWADTVMPGFLSGDPTPEKLLMPFQMWPEAKDTMRYLNTLSNEGLLTDEFIIDKDDSMFKQKIARGEIFAFIAAGHYPYHSAYGSLYDQLRAAYPEAELASIDTFRLSKDVPTIMYGGSNPVYQYKFFIPAASSNAELGVKLLNYLSSEEVYLTGGLGVEGVDYNLVNSVAVPIDAEKYAERIPWIEPQFATMAKPFPRPADKELFLENYIKDFNPDYHDQIRREAKFLADLTNYTPTLTLPTPVSDRVTSMLNSFWDDEIAKIITAPAAQFDAVFDAAINEYKAMGGDEKHEEALAVYKEQMGQ